MSDQAELLRKRREARQKKIIASGESRLSKITGTAGTSTQVAPSPAVLHAREQLLMKEQEEERLKAIRAAGGDASNIDDSQTTAQSPQLHDDEEELAVPSSPSQRAAANRIARQRSASSAHAGVNATNNAASTTNAGARTGPTTVEDANDADPDDSLGAPPAHVPLPFSNNGSQQNPFMFSSPQHQQAMTRMMQEDDGNNGSRAAATHQQNPFGNMPPGFTVITPQVDQTAWQWKLLHFILSALFGLIVVFSEYNREGDFGRFDALATDKPLPYGVYQVAPIPVFWYFITMELILQSTRMALHGVTASPSSTLGTIAGFLPSPFSDIIRVFMRYRLIWSSMVNDLSVVVFIVGLTIVFTHMFS